MKYTLAIVLSLVMMAGIQRIEAQKEKPQKTKKTKPVSLKNGNDSLSYCIGVAVMKNIKDQGVENVNLDALSKGMSDIINNSFTISPEAANKYVNDYFFKQYSAKAEKDKKAQLDWLEENKKKEGVVVTASGLQYKIITQGTGPKPQLTNTVKVHYAGTLIDGKTFDSSYDRGEPIEFPVTGVIKGWTEALQMMPQGSKWELYIPYDLAYGEKGAGGAIGPYATLIFVVELLEVK